MMCAEYLYWMYLTFDIRASKFGSGRSDLFDTSFFLHVGHSLFLFSSVNKFNVNDGMFVQRLW